METYADSLREPDETRPAKRVRLEAPLDVTEEIEEEIIDDEDLYGDDTEGAAAEARDVVNELDMKPTVGEDHAHELPNNIITSDAGVHAETNGFANLSADVEELYGGDKAETIDEIPAEAIDHGEDEFVAPPRYDAGGDGVEEAIMGETSHVEVEPPLPDGTIEDGAQKASTPATEPLNPKLSQSPIGESYNHRDRFEAAAPDVKDAEVEEAKKGGGGNNEADDIYANLESTLTGNAAKEPVEEAHVARSKPTGDPEFMEAAAAQKGSAAAEWQFDSSDAESSSDSSDSSDDPDSESDDGVMLDPETAAKILMSGDGDEDDGKEKGVGGGRGPRTQNEVKDEVVPKPDVTVTDDMKITLLGTIDRVVENMALIKGGTPGEYQVLESGSVLCNAARKVLGAVGETFGRVQEPMYSVAFTNAQEIDDLGLSFGTEVCYVDSHSTFVFTQPLKGMKGTDASNIHDEEVGEDELEFSDDEKEAEYKRMKKAAKRGGHGGLSRTDFNADRSDGRSFGAPGHDSGQTFIGSGATDVPQTTYGGGMSYDDGDTQEDFYQPLKRPDNLSQLMSGAPPPPPSHRGGFDRGRGRARGRGDRGRGDRGRGRGGAGNQRGNKSEGFGGGGQRGAHDPSNGHRSAAHSFPDRHNQGANKPRGQKAHQLPAKPQQTPASPAQSQPSPQQPYQQYPPFPPAPPQQQAPSPQTYQFNGYNFQYGNAPPAPYQAQQQAPQQYHQAYQQPPQPQQQSSGASQFPAGAYVNPAFWAGQSQQQQPQAPQQYAGWNAQQPRHSQAQAQGQGQYPQAQPQALSQSNLADILRTLGGQGQGQG